MLKFRNGGSQQEIPLVPLGVSEDPKQGECHRLVDMVRSVER